MNTAKMYISKLGMLSAIGQGAKANYAAVRASISGYEDSNYAAPQGGEGSPLLPVKMALVPESILPEIDDAVFLLGAYSRWHEHLLRLAHLPMVEAMAGYSDEQPVPLLLSCPEKYTQQPDQLPEHFLSDLIIQTGLPINKGLSRLLHTGRPGALGTLQMAQTLLSQDDVPAVLIGGVDSFQRPELLRALLSQARIKHGVATDGFVPGEGAAFILLTKNPALALQHNGQAIRLLPAGNSKEPGHLYSDEPYFGEGLAQATRSALSGYQGAPIAAVYSSMNGEHYWSKELGVTIIRNQPQLAEQYTTEHPADCLGDTGAAAGAFLIGLAAQAMLESSATSPSQGASLILCSADNASRSAAIIVNTAVNTAVNAVQTAQKTCNDASI